MGEFLSSAPKEVIYHELAYHRPLIDACKDFLSENPHAPIAAVCIDGPSSAGKRLAARIISKTLPDTLGIDGDLFLKPRTERPLPYDVIGLARIKPEEIAVENWHDFPGFTRFLDTLFISKRLRISKTLEVYDLYTHDAQGGTGNSVTAPMDFNSLVLAGRFTHLPQVLNTLDRWGIPTLKIIFDALPSTRLARVLDRVAKWNSRPINQQQLIQTRIVEPDWLRYLPEIFLQADLYVSNDGQMLLHKPRELVDTSHTWGRYAQLITDWEKREIFRMIEIGTGGRTSIHRHSALREIYYVAEGPLEVRTGERSDNMDTQILQKGENVLIQPGFWHSAGSYQGSRPLYYETVQMLPECLDLNNDIEKHQPAIPMSGNLQVFDF